MSNHFSLPVAIILVSLSSVVTAVESADPMRPEDYATKMTDGKDTKTATKKPSVIHYWVQSIQIGDGQRSATINGQLLKIGDKIRGAQLIAIEHHQVQLRRAGKLIKLKFLPRTIKR